MRKKGAGLHMPPVPEGFLREMEACFGVEETLLLARALEDKPSVSIRINRNKVPDLKEFMKRFADFCPSPVPWCDSGFYLEKRPDFVHDPLLHAGCYYVQEAASMVYESIAMNLLSAVDSDVSLNVLDLCAAPGGKTTALLNALRGRKYKLIANEFDSRRASILKENLDKWGDPDVIITNSQTSKFSQIEDFFDILAVDAPCSGEGMMRREPIARSQWSPSLVQHCASLQKDILTDAVTTLRPGGFLIYSTCTFNEEENEKNVHWLEECLGLDVVNKPRHFLPHRDRCEGLFISVLRKPEESICSSRQSAMIALKKAGIRIISNGIEKTIDKGGIQVPSSKIVLATDFDRSSFPKVELSRYDALAYLRRQSIVLPADTPNGYIAVYYEGHPLGLVKNLGNRANNLYPSEWRILN